MDNIIQNLLNLSMNYPHRFLHVSLLSTSIYTVHLFGKLVMTFYFFVLLSSSNTLLAYYYGVRCFVEFLDGLVHLGFASFN